MAKIYIDASQSYMAYAIEGSGLSGSGYSRVPYQSIGKSSFHRPSPMEAKLVAVSNGLNQYYLAWNNELDSRQYNYDIEASVAKGEPVYAKVATPAGETKRELPPAVLVCIDDEFIVKILAKQTIIPDDLIRLAKRIWQQSQNVEVRYQWIKKKENLATKLLP